MPMLRLASVVGACAFLAAGPAFAGGDCGALTRQKNAICEMQKRGEGPLSPNMCLPEISANQGETPQRARW